MPTTPTCPKGHTNTWVLLSDGTAAWCRDCQEHFPFSHPIAYPMFFAPLFEVVGSLTYDAATDTLS